MCLCVCGEIVVSLYVIDRSGIDLSYREGVEDDRSPVGQK